MCFEEKERVKDSLVYDIEDLFKMEEREVSSKHTQRHERVLYVPA